MSTNWEDPTGDAYEKYTGEPRPGGPPRPAPGQPPSPGQPPASGAAWTGPGSSPQDAPQDAYRGAGPTASYPPPPQGYPGPGGTAYPGQPYPGYGPNYAPPTYLGPGVGTSSPYASTVPIRSGSAITLLTCPSH